MINLGQWGAIAGSITAIVSLILLVIRPIVASFTKNYENTITSELQLGTINKRFRIEQIRSIDDS